MNAVDIAEIKRLKYWYFRFLDLKQFDDLAQLLTADATAAYGDVDADLQGRDAVVGFLKETLSDGGIITLHQGHHPEIELTGPDTARGSWYFIDRVIIPAADLEIGGSAFYDDVYSRTNGRWLISHTGYQRVFEEHRHHRSGELISFRSRFSQS